MSPNGGFLARNGAMNHPRIVYVCDVFEGQCKRFGRRLLQTALTLKHGILHGCHDDFLILRWPPKFPGICGILMGCHGGGGKKVLSEYSFACDSMMRLSSKRITKPYSEPIQTVLGNSEN